MIPKKIHYCWFGGNELSPLNKRCIEGWKQYLPDWEVKKWDESNSPLDVPFIKGALKRKAWAHVSDYVRLYALSKEGGIYLDTDVLIVKSFDELIANEMFIGAIYNDWLGSSIIGSQAGNKHIVKLLGVYNDFDQFDYSVNTKFFTEHFQDLGYTDFSNLVEGSDFTIYPNSYFYAYPKRAGYMQDKVDKYLTPESCSVHLWETSWLEDEFVDFWWDKFGEGGKKAVKRVLSNPFQSRFYYRKLVWHFIRFMKIKLGRVK